MEKQVKHFTSVVDLFLWKAHLPVVLKSFIYIFWSHFTEDITQIKFNAFFLSNYFYVIYYIHTSLYMFCIYMKNTIEESCQDCRTRLLLMIRFFCVLLTLLENNLKAVQTELFVAIRLS